MFDGAEGIGFGKVFHIIDLHAYLYVVNSKGLMIVTGGNKEMEKGKWLPHKRRVETCEEPLLS